MLLMKYLGMHLKSKMQYKLSFFLIMIAQGLVIIVSYIGMYALFERFGGIKGFTLYEVLISFTIIHLGFTIAEIFARGFDQFSRLIKKGEFDLLLIKPRNIFLQIIGSNIAYEKTGRVISTSIILIYALSKITINGSQLKLLLLIPMLISSIFVFTSIFILGAALTFVTIEGLEIVNIFTDGSKEFGKYPIGIYNKKVVMFFTFVIPLAGVNYYPLLYILGRSNNIIYALSPLLGIFLIIPSIIIFKFGMKKYQGTGS